MVEGERDFGIDMAIRIEKTFQIEEPIERVWKFMSDPRKVVNCLPGAQITETVDDRTFKGLIKIQVGPGVTDYKGQVHIERLDEQNHEIEIVGKGQDARGKGSASMKMTGKVQSLPRGSTEVVSVAEVNVGGLLAQMGARMIQEVSSEIFAEFASNLCARLHEERVPASESAKTQTTVEAPRPIKALPIVLSIARETAGRFFRRIFKGSDFS
jgi:carbon monoxide dehydrogenase subunit G